MTEPEKGPHYIPELDPEGSAWQPGDGGQRTFWICFVLSIAVFVGAAFAFYNGSGNIGLGLVILGFILLIPIMIGEAIF